MNRLTIFVALLLAACSSGGQESTDGASPGPVAYLVGSLPLEDARLRAVDAQGRLVALDAGVENVRLSEIATASGCPAVIVGADASEGFAAEQMFLLKDGRLDPLLGDAEGWAPSIDDDCKVRYLKPLGGVRALTEIADLENPTKQELILAGDQPLRWPRSTRAPKELLFTESARIGKQGDMLLALTGDATAFSRVIRITRGGVVKWSRPVDRLTFRLAGRYLVAGFDQLVDPASGALIKRLDHSVLDTDGRGRGLAIADDGKELVILGGPMLEKVVERITLEEPASIAAFAP